MNNTFFSTPKDDPRDKITLEIGDSKRVAWNKGKRGIYSAETIEKMRVAKVGKCLSDEHKKKISDSLTGRMPKNIHLLDNSGSNSHWWKGGITKENELARKGKEFKLWRKLVFERDDYTCRKCIKRSKAKDRISLHPHHVKNFSKHIKVRFVVDNGATLCEKCHRLFHKIYGSNSNNNQQLIEFYANV